LKAPSSAPVSLVALPDDAAPAGPAEASRWAAEALSGGGLEPGRALALGLALGREEVREPLLEAADESVRRHKGPVVTVSRNVFIPLTNLCRDRCAYCTFAKLPDSPEAKTYTLDEVAEVVRGGVLTGCSEALFCLGDKPEVAYRSYREELSARGYGSTAELLIEACRVAFDGGMLPHTNAGILSIEEMAELRKTNASMGLMLETTSQRLRGKGMPHQYAPDKDPAVRLRMHDEAGQLRIPFTTGILLGIGEDARERVETFYAMRELDERHHHIQEVIVQPFHPKPGTRMRAASSLPDEQVAGWIALSRLILGPAMNIQAPPNLGTDVLPLLLRSGLNDWGGVSPVTLDFINPEAPWPAIQELRRATEAGGRELRDRLPVYPEWVTDRPDFFDPQVRAALSRFATDAGHARRPNQQSGGEEAA